MRDFISSALHCGSLSSTTLHHATAYYESDRVVYLANLHINQHVMKKLTLLSPILTVFALTTMIVLVARSTINEAGLDAGMLLGGNLFLVVLSVISFLLLHRSVKTPNPQSFIQNFYLSFLVKFVLVAGVALWYALAADKVNRLSVIICMALYLVYTFIELRVILKESKRYNAP